MTFDYIDEPSGKFDYIDEAPEASWSDVPRNAVKDVKAMATGIPKAIGTLAMKDLMLPGEVMSSGVDVLRGKPFSETPLAQEGRDFIDTEKGIVNNIAHEVRHPINSFKEHPFNTAMDAASVVLPALETLGGGAEGLSELAEIQKAKSFGLTKGMVKKLAPEGISDMREIGRTALDKGIGGPFTSNETALEQAGKLGREAGENIGKTYKTLDDAKAGTFDPLRAAQDLEAKGESVSGLENATNISEKYRKGVNDILGLGDNPSLQDAANRKQAYGDLSYKHMNSSESNAAMRDVYDSINKELDEAVKSGYGKIGTPEEFYKYLESKKQYGTSKAIGTALQDKEYRELSGSTKPTLYSAAADYAGKQIRPFVAHGADWLSRTIKATPKILGQYAAPLMQAAQRGSQSLAVTHYLLQSTDPQYQKMIADLEKAQ